MDLSIQWYPTEFLIIKISLNFWGIKLIRELLRLLRIKNIEKILKRVIILVYKDYSNNLGLGDTTKKSYYGRETLCHSFSHDSMSLILNFNWGLWKSIRNQLSGGFNLYYHLGMRSTSSLKLEVQ